MPGHEPDADLAAASARQVAKAMNVIRAIAPGTGSYVNETDYFEPAWTRSCADRGYSRCWAETSPGTCPTATWTS